MKEPLPKTEVHGVLLQWLAKCLCEDDSDSNAQRLQTMAVARVPKEERSTFLAKSNDLILICAYKRTWLTGTRESSRGHPDSGDLLPLTQIDP